LFYPYGSGAELATYLYAELLSQSGFNVTVITNSFSEKTTTSVNKNLVVYRLPLFRGNISNKYSILMRLDILLSSFLRRLIKWSDLVYVPRFWYSAIPLAKACKKPVIAHLHDYVPVCPLSNNYDVSKAKVCNSNPFYCNPKCICTFEKMQNRDRGESMLSIGFNCIFGRNYYKLIRLSDAVICVSKSQRDMIVEKDQSLRDRVSVVYNPLPESKHIGVEGDDFGYYGGPSFLKGFHTLYEAIVRVNSDHQRRVRIHATKFLNSNKVLVKSLSKWGFVVHGKLGTDEYAKIYSMVRSVIVPSVWPEPWPYVVVEAIIQGRYLIASDVGGIPEQIQGCKGVSLCQAGNCQELADTISFVRDLDRDDLVELGQQNREIFCRKYNNSDTVKRLIRVIENTVT
jgi:glycosyltransferase involved in cell wall biosynthesis